MRLEKKFFRESAVAEPGAEEMPGLSNHCSVM